MLDKAGKIEAINGVCKKKPIDHHFKSVQLFAKASEVYSNRNKKYAEEFNYFLETKKKVQDLRSLIPNDLNEEKFVLSDKAIHIMEELKKDYNIDFENTDDKTSLNLEISSKIDQLELKIKGCTTWLSANLNESHTGSLMGRLSIQLSSQEKQTSVQHGSPRG